MNENLERSRATPGGTGEYAAAGKVRAIDPPLAGDSAVTLRRRGPGSRSRGAVSSFAAQLDGQLAVVLACLAYVLTYIVVYGVLVAPLYETSGLVNRLSVDGSAALAFVIATMPAFWLPLSANRPSDAALWVMYLTGYVPTIVVPAFVLGTGWQLLPLWFAVGGSFTLVTMLAGRVNLRVPRIPVSRAGYAWVIGVFAIVLVAAILIWFRLPSGVNFDVTSVRDDYREALAATGGFAGYAVLWSAQVIGPLLIAYGLWSGRRRLVVAGIAVFVLVYAMTAFRSLIFELVLLAALIVLVARWRARFGVILPLLMSGLVVGSAIAASFGWLLPASLIIRRLLVVPGQVMAYYYDFFSQGPVYGLSHSVLEGLVARPYAETPPAIIGRLYFHDARTSANGNLWADGMANFGLAGVVVASLLFALVLIALNAAGRGRPATVAIPLSGIGVWRMTNSGLLTSMASHGLGVLIALLWLLPPGRPRPPREGPRRVAHVTTVHRSDDPRIYLKECASLAAAGFDVVLIGRGAPPAVSAGVRFVSIGEAGSRRSRMVLLPLRALREARRQKADVYHIHDPELIPVGMVLKLLGSRVIYDAHEDLPRQIRYKAYLPSPLRPATAAIAAAVEWIVGRTFDGVVTVTTHIAARFPADKTLVARNFPLLTEFAGREPGPYDRRPQTVAYVGRITAEVGGLVMADTARLVGQDRGAMFVFAGPVDQILGERMRGRAHPASIELPGWYERAQVLQLLDEARVGVVVFQPLGNYVDSYPTKLFEYMAAGIPVVASDFPYYREVVEASACGVLVDPEDPAAVAGAIDALLDDPESAAAMGQRGREATLRQYNWEREAEGLVAFYRRLIGRIEAAPEDIVPDGRLAVPEARP